MTPTINATGYQIMLRAIIRDLEAQHGASAVLPITRHLAQADDALRVLYSMLRRRFKNAEGVSNV